MMSSKKEINQNQSFYMAEPKNEEYIRKIVNGILDRRLKEKSFYEVLPRTEFSDNEELYFGTGKDFSLLFDGTDFVIDKGTTNILHVNYTGNVTTITGGAVSGDDLTLKGDSVNDTGKILIKGAGGIDFFHAAGSTFNFYEASTPFGYLKEEIDMVFGSQGNKNIYLNPGTGHVKFGTYSAKGAETFAGFITMKDEDGNPRKLMICA